MKSANVVIPPAHRSDSPTRWVKKHDMPKKEWHPSDDTSEVFHLHTLTRYKKAPLPTTAIKEIVLEYHRNTGKLPSAIRTPNGRPDISTTVWFKEFGALTIRFPKGEFSVF